MNPAIVLVAPEHAAGLIDEFGRYVRDYDLRTDQLGREAEEVARRVGDAGARWRCSSTIAAARRPRAPRVPLLAPVVPTARRIVAAHWEHFRADAPTLRGRPGHGQVRRLPADAARRARRGVPHRRHRAALRLGLHRRRARGRTVQIISPGPRRAHPGDPRLPLPDGDADRGRRARLASRAARCSRALGGDDGASRVVSAARPRTIQATSGARRRDLALRRPDRHRRRQGRRPGRRRRRPGRPRRRGLRAPPRA